MWISFYVSTTIDVVYSFLLKQEYGEPDMYLCVKINKTRLHYGGWAWAIIPTKYVCEIVRNHEAYLRVKYSSRY